MNATDVSFVDTVAAHPIAWGLFVIYLVATSALAWIGHRKTQDIASFAVGSGDMSPWIVGVTLASSVASAATFVLNPGLVYLYGAAALMHLGVAAGIGVLIGLFSLSFGFRRVGASAGALTLPHWMGQRFGSRGMALFFAAVNLLSITFMVLIVGGLAIVMQVTLGLGHTAAVLIIIGFVFSYIFIGGTWAHAYTNTLQGLVMVVVAAIIVASGLGELLDGGWERLAAIDPALIAVHHPRSPLYGSLFSVWISGFVVGFALVCQPHILTKALYVKSDRAVLKYLLVSTGVSVFFTALLLVGLYAHLSDIPREAFLGANGLPAADKVVTVYIHHAFGPVLRAIIAVALMAAGMSTLDGILVALSSIAANDLFLGLAGPLLRDRTDGERATLAHRASQVILVALGIGTAAIALDPPPLLSIFGQVGVFGIAAASCAPIVFGVFGRGVPRGAAFSAAVTGLAVYVALFLWGRQATAAGINLVEVVNGWGAWGALFDTSMPQLGLLNPAVPATWGVISSFVVGLVAWAIAARAGGSESEDASQGTDSGSGRPAANLGS